MHKKIFILILVDQITKLIFWPRDFFLGLIHIHPVKNFGLIFSVNLGLLPNLVVVALALGFFIYFYYKNKYARTSFGKIIFVLILAGAFSNLIDRLYLGYVRDFVDINLGFTFNLADVMVAFGLILILISENKTNQLS